MRTEPVVTMEDIAREVGVSKVTVSRVLAGQTKGRRPDAARRAREIHRVAREMGYRPNLFARATRTGRCGTLGLLLSKRGQFSDLPRAMLNGIQEGCDRYAQQLLIGTLPDEHLTSSMVMPRILREWACDGLLVNYTDHVPPAMVELMERHAIPAVWLNAKRDHNCVYPDERQAGRRLTEHLLSEGRRRIAYVDTSHGAQDLPAAHYSAMDRLAGYEQAMRDAGLPGRVYIGHGPVAQRHYASVVRSLLGSPDRPDAVIAYALPLLDAAAVAAADLGLSLLRDLELATFTDTPKWIAGQFVPTVITPRQAMGLIAVDMLMELVAGPRRAVPGLAVPYEESFIEPPEAPECVPAVERVYRSESDVLSGGNRKIEEARP